MVSSRMQKHRDGGPNPRHDFVSPSMRTRTLLADIEPVKCIGKPNAKLYHPSFGTKTHKSNHKSFHGVLLPGNLSRESNMRKSPQ